MKRRNFVFAAPALLGGSLLASTFARAQAGSVIRFGQSAALSGDQSAYGQGIRDGILAAFTAASGDDEDSPRFELVSLDDAGDRSLCEKNVSALIESGVSGVIGLTSSDGAEACIPVAADSKTALLGTASGNMGIRSNDASYHVRAGYALEYERMATYIRDFGMRRVGVVYVRDTTTLNLGALSHALADLSIVPSEVLAIDRGASSFDDVAAKLLGAKLDCVMFASNAEPVAAVIDTMNTARYPGMFYASSLAGQGLIDTLIERQQGCVISTVVPRPNADASDVVADYQKDLLALNPDSKIGVTTMEGYIAGRTAVEAARAALLAGNGETVSNVRMRESLADLRSDFGGYRVDFAPGVTEGSRFVELMAVNRHGQVVG